MSKKSLEFGYGSQSGTFPEVVNDFYKSSGARGDLSEFEPSLTRQEFAEECDINALMARYEATGVISHVNRAEPMYLDTTSYPDLRGAMDAFRQASESFYQLPALVRREFDNDPQKFVDFAADEKNVERMREWGLAAPVAPAPEPFSVRIVGDATLPASDKASDKPA